MRRVIHFLPLEFIFLLALIHFKVKFLLYPLHILFKSQTQKKAEGSWAREYKNKICMKKTYQSFKFYPLWKGRFILPLFSVHKKYFRDLVTFSFRYVSVSCSWGRMKRRLYAAFMKFKQVAENIMFSMNSSIRFFYL